jgi:hypothetical protein
MNKKLTIFIFLIAIGLGVFWLINRSKTGKLNPENLSLLKIAKVGTSVSEGVTSDKYAFKTKDNGIVQIGTERHSPPKPYIALDKWGGEISLKLRMPFETGDNPTVIGNKLRYSTADKNKDLGLKIFDFPKADAQTATSSPRVDIDVYPKPIDQQNEDGGVEFDTIFYEKPTTSQIVFPIEIQNLDFFYQPPLNQEIKVGEDGAVRCTETDCYNKYGKTVDHRPENVVGSYAVYYKDRKSGDFSKMGGKNYKTGKAFQIYRPKVTDAKNNSTWGTLDIDTKTNTLTIAVDQNWLNNAAYPVTVDPTFGYTTAGGSATSANSWIYTGGDTWTGAAGGGVSMTGSFKTWFGNNQNVQMGVYDNATPGNLITNATTNSVLVNNASQGWYTANFASGPTFSAVPYNLAFWEDGTVYVYYDSTAVAGFRYINGYSPFSWPASIYWSTSGLNYRFSIYVTYLLPPTITTSAATSVTGTTATLNGSITNTGGSNPTVTVYWGQSDGGTTPGNWANNSAPTSPGQPQGVGTFTENITGLTAGTRYYFSAKAVNPGGTSWGSTQNFIAGTSTIIGKGTDTYALLIDSSLNVTGYINSTASASIQITKAWHHVVMTYDGANIKLYVDGVLQVTTAKTGAINTNSVNLILGANMSGKLNDMRVYSRALSQTEVTAWYDQYNSGIVISNLQKGLIGQWKFNGNAKDSTPYGNDGTDYGATLTTDRKGQSNKAYSFNGTNNYIALSDSTALKPTTALTVSSWVNPTDFTCAGVDTDCAIFSKYSNYHGYRLFALSSGILGFSVCTPSTCSYAWSSVAPSTGSWSHVVGVWDGVNMQIYINGTPSGSPVAVSTITQDTTAPTIGMASWYNGDYFHGSIDDVRVYNRALSPTEIKTVYDSYDSGIVISNLQQGLIGQWKFNGNAKDSTPYGNDGTDYGATLTTDRKGQANKAYNFGGTSDYIDVGTGLAGKTYPLTFSAWVKPTTLAQDAIIVNFDVTDANSDFAFGIYNSGNQILVGRSTYQYGLTGPSTYLTAGQWSHWVVVFTDTTHIAFYLNGVAQTLSNISQYYSVDGSRVTIGYRGGASPDKWINGSIDEVRIYNRALSATEVKALYESY